MHGVLYIKNSMVHACRRSRCFSQYWPHWGSILRQIRELGPWIELWILKRSVVSWSQSRGEMRPPRKNTEKSWWGISKLYINLWYRSKKTASDHKLKMDITPFATPWLRNWMPCLFKCVHLKVSKFKRKWYERTCSPHWPSQGVANGAIPPLSIGSPHFRSWP